GAERISGDPQHPTHARALTPVDAPERSRCDRAGGTRNQGRGTGGDPRLPGATDGVIAGGGAGARRRLRSCSSVTARSTRRYDRSQAVAGISVPAITRAGNGEHGVEAATRPDAGSLQSP